MWDKPKASIEEPNYPLTRQHKRCWSILTAGRLPWKPETAQECVTAHLPNGPALKMDGA